MLSSEIRLPAADVPTPFLDADDNANVAVEALTADRHVGQLYELTGPLEVVDGRNANATDGVQRALGRQPKDFVDYARAATTGVWEDR